MKRILFILSVIALFPLLFSCEVGQPENEPEEEVEKYKLTVIDNFGYLAYELEGYYEAGEEIRATIIFLSGPTGGVCIDGEPVTDQETTKDAKLVYTFTMPERDCTLYTTQNGNATSDCGEGKHIWDAGQLVSVPGGGTDRLYNCKLCPKSRSERVSDPQGAIAFDSIYGISEHLDLSRICEIRIDHSRGIVGGADMRDVTVTTDPEYISRAVAFINSAILTPATDLYDGVGSYTITLSDGTKSFEFSFSERDEYFINNRFYNSSESFPTAPLRADEGYMYIKPRDEVILSSYGNTTPLRGFDISEVHLTELDIDHYAYDCTKDCDLIIDGELFRVIGDTLLYSPARGMYAVTSGKSFSELLPKEEATATVTFLNESESELGRIIVSRGTAYTKDELIDIVLAHFTDLYPISIADAGGDIPSEYVFSSDCSLTLIISHGCDA